MFRVLCYLLSFQGEISYDFSTASRVIKWSLNDMSFRLTEMTRRLKQVNNQVTRTPSSRVLSSMRTHYPFRLHPLNHSVQFHTLKQNRELSDRALQLWRFRYLLSHPRSRLSLFPPRFPPGQTASPSTDRSSSRSRTSLSFARSPSPPLSSLRRGRNPKQSTWRNTSSQGFPEASPRRRSGALAGESPPLRGLFSKKAPGNWSSTIATPR